jgi:hypothetical protein
VHRRMGNSSTDACDIEETRDISLQQVALQISIKVAEIFKAHQYNVL